MRSKTLIELLTLSTNLYLMSKDEEFMNNLTEMAKKGKQKVENLIDHLSEDDGREHALLEKLAHKAKQAKDELEAKVEEIAVRVYKKMHIAHTDDLHNILGKLETMEKKINLLEARINGQFPGKS